MTGETSKMKSAISELFDFSMAAMMSLICLFSWYYDLVIEIEEKLT